MLLFMYEGPISNYNIKKKNKIIPPPRDAPSKNNIFEYENISIAINFEKIS